MSYKDQYLEKFEAYKQLLENGKVPESLKPMVRSIRKKLEAEESSYRDRFENSSGRVQMPSMGLVEMTSEKTDEPEYFFGSRIRSRDRIRVRVYQASLNPETEEIFKETLLSDTVMTEKQLADVISNPGRGTGYPTTQIVRMEEAVEAYNPEKDPGKSDLKRLRDGLGQESRVDLFREKSRKVLEEARAAGRLKKSDGVDLASTLKAGTEGMADTARYQVGRMAKTYADTIAEAQMTIHMDIRSEQAKLGHDKGEE